MGGSCGPRSTDVLAREIDELRRRLGELRLDDMPLEQARALGEQITAIRSELKRLEADRERATHYQA